MNQAPPPPPGPGTARVRVLRVGVCGTDLHAFAGRQPMIRYPLVLGHELAVELVELGPDAPPNAPLPGTLCTVVPYLSCGDCVACRRGLTNACVQLKVLGVHVDGGLTEYMNLPVDLLVPAGDLPPEHVALVEMLAVGEHAAVRAAPEPGEPVLVVGVGPIGLAAAAALKRLGVRLALHDVSEERVAFAAARGLGTPVRAGDEDLEGRVAEAFGGELPRLVVEATGHAGSMVAAPALLAPGGRLVLVGHTGGALPFDNQTLHRRELTVLASRNATPSDFANVLAGLRDGSVDVTGWVTHRAPLEDVPAALPAWVQRPAGLVKAVVEVA